MPSSSNSTRPGFTTATHPSGFPLPFPIRVSAGFLVIGLSGNSRIHTLPPRFISRVRATREASRSEEHTSELQSQSNLVCRLLLEKKKNNDCALSTHQLST